MHPSAPTSCIGRTAVDADGDKIGKIGQVYLNDGTGQPEWVTVSHRPVRHQAELRPGVRLRVDR